jgi:hypothetical protein
MRFDQGGLIEPQEVLQLCSHPVVAWQDAPPGIFGEFPLFVVSTVFWIELQTLCSLCWERTRSAGSQFTFAGNILNLAIADTLRQHGYDVRVSDFWICVKDTTDYQLLFEKIDGFNAEAVRAAFRIPEEYLKQLKFSECLPQPYAAEIVKDRLLQPAYLETLLRKCCKFVVVA